MARVLAKEARPKVRGKYPWAKWANGEVWLLERGKDYTVPDLSMARQVLQYASTHDMKAATSSHEDGIVVHFTKPAVRRPLTKK